MKEIYKSLLDPKGKFGIWGIAAIIMIGILFMVVPSFYPDADSKGNWSEETRNNFAQINEQGVFSLTQLEKQLAQQAEEILNQGAGFGKVSVAVTLEAGPEQDFARNEQNRESVVDEKETSGSIRTTSEAQRQVEYVFAQRAGEPLLLREKSAPIKGVLAIAEGAVDSRLKRQLSQALQSLYDLPAHRIMVLPMKGR